jgi:hypothetical protein
MVIAMERGTKLKILVHITSKFPYFDSANSNGIQRLQISNSVPADAIFRIGC